MFSLNDIKATLSKINSPLTDQEHYDAIEKTSNYATYGASTMTVAAGLTINEWGVVVGIAATVITLAFNIWFKMKYQRGGNNED